MTINDITAKMKPILAAHGVIRAAVFGSHARGEERAGSDLDLLVTFNERKSLLMLIRIERELSESVGVKVDLLTEQAISPYLRERIEAEACVIYR